METAIGTFCSKTCPKLYPLHVLFLPFYLSMIYFLMALYFMKNKILQFRNLTAIENNNAQHIYCTLNSYYAVRTHKTYELKVFFPEVVFLHCTWAPLSLGEKSSWFFNTDGYSSPSLPYRTLSFQGFEDCRRSYPLSLHFLLLWSTISALVCFIELSPEILILNSALVFLWLLSYI